MIRRPRQRGYLLLPVAVIVAVVAAVALLISYESSLESGITVASHDQQRVQYVAEAGVSHARWLAAREGCGPYSNLTSEPLGGDEYSTVLTTDLGATTSYLLPVERDTWINEKLPTVNHGSDIKLDVALDAGFASHTLLRYDLATLPAKASILAATLYLHVDSEFPLGPHRVQRITADWTEAGATWANVGAALEEAAQAVVAPQPVNNTWVAINLTAQAQAWSNGQPNFGIALTPSVELEKAKYASRESARPSYLEVIVGTPPTPRATLKATAKLAGGVAHSVTRDDVALIQAPLQYFELQPDAAAGRDAFLKQDGANLNFGTSPDLWVEQSSGVGDDHGLLRFDLGGIPRGARIARATLELFAHDASAPGGEVGVHRVARSWVEGVNNGANGSGASWNKHDGTGNWTTPGGDFDGPAIASSVVAPFFTGPVQWDLTPLVQGWVSGRYANDGLLLRGETDGTLVGFRSSDHPIAAEHPRLVVTYRCACGSVCVPPQGSGTILFVVSDSPGWMTDAELRKQALFESWGYTVDLIADWDVGWSFGGKAATSDVVYVSKDVTASEWNLAPTLAAAPIGIVSEKGQLNDELGIASGFGKPVGTGIEIVSSDHYVTRPFAVGGLEIFDRPMTGMEISGTPAPDLVTLADMNSAGALVALDTGDALYGGGNAPARRVMLPLGKHVTDFNLDYVNANGLLLMQRAIDWAMDKQAGAAGVGLWTSTGADVIGSGAPGLDAWDSGEALAFGGTGFTLEPPTTAGEFSSVINLENFAADVDLDALHYVGSDLTVGGDNAVDLKIGDLLLSTSTNLTLTSNNSITVNKKDVFVYRPDTPGDYSVGTFIFLLDGPQIHGENDTVGVSLVERNTVVGDGVLYRGEFLLATTNRRDVQRFAPTDVGRNTTAGTLTEFIDGPSLGFGSEIRGIELAEEAILLGGQTIPAGSILLTLNNDDPDGVGDNNVPADSADAFYLTVTQTGATPVADATLLFEGLDVGLDTSDEHLQALALNVLVTPYGTPGPYDVLLVVGDPASLTPEQQAKKTLIESWGHRTSLIATNDSQAAFDSAAAAADVVYIPELGTGPMSELGGKANDLATGVITEESRRALLLGAFSFTPFFDGDSIDIVDNSHYLTETLPLGTVQLSTAVQSLWVLKPALATDLNVLGELDGGQPGLAYLEIGELRNDDTPAPARRVKLPWGAYSFDVDLLTDDGLEIMRRAIEWGAGVDTGPIAHWKLDETAGPTAADSAGNNDGTLSGDPAWTPGLIDGALALDGSGDYVTAGGFDAVGSGLTMLTWLNAASLPASSSNLLGKSSGPSAGEVWWELGINDVGTERYLRTRIRAGGTTETLTDASVNFEIDRWYLAVATYDNSSGMMRLYVDGVEVANKSHASGGTLATDPSVPVALGATGSGQRLFDGLLDDARVYNRALNAAEIAALYAADAPPAGASYTELYQPWTAATPDNWETVDLAPFGVPADAVVEVAVINAAISAQRYGGVRAVGSALDRRVLLHEAEGGGVDALTMHVQADAASRIEHYSDNTGQVSFILLGYWTGASYVELFEPFSADASGSWVVEGLSNDGAGPNQVVEIAIYNIITNGERWGGVRPTGSTDERRFLLHEPEGGGRDFVTLMVETDGSANIEVYAQSDWQVFFQLLGYWSTPPGSYTSTGGANGQVSTLLTWEPNDLAPFGVPANSVAQFVLSNESPSADAELGTRQTGSALQRRLNLQEAESGGTDMVTMHVNVDAGAQVEWYAQYGGTRYFYPVGWWVLPP